MEMWPMPLDLRFPADFPDSANDKPISGGDSDKLVATWNLCDLMSKNDCSLFTLQHVQELCKTYP